MDVHEGIITTSITYFSLQIYCSIFLTTEKRVRFSIGPFVSANIIPENTDCIGRITISRQKLLAINAFNVLWQLFDFFFYLDYFDLLA